MPSSIMGREWIRMDLDKKDKGGSPMKKTKGRRKASVILLFLVFLVLLCGCGSHKGEEVKNRGQEEVETIENYEI